MKSSLNILAAFLSLVGLILVERTRTTDSPLFGLIGTVALLGAIAAATVAAVSDPSDEPTARS